MIDFLAMAILALKLWSHNLPMEFQIYELEPGYAPGVVAAAAPMNTEKSLCRLWFKTADMAGLEPDFQQNIVTHEVGHCLGLDHPEATDSRQTIMREINGGITRTDVLNYQHLWRTNRNHVYTIPGLVRDTPVDFNLEPDISNIPVVSPVELTLEQIVAQYPWDLQSAHNIIMCESKWDIWAINPSSGACGLWQHLPCEGLGDPELSTALAWSKYESRGWQPWSDFGCSP